MNHEQYIIRLTTDTAAYSYFEEYLVTDDNEYLGYYQDTNEADFEF